MFEGLKSATRLLHPGLGLKRWFIPLLTGLIITGLGIGIFLSALANQTTVSFTLQPLFQYWPGWYPGAALALFGLGLTSYSIYRLNKLLLQAILPNKQATVGYVAEQVYRHHRRKRRGPKVVVIGGGTGLSVLLRGLKHHTENITAIVTVADDGGSSGKLRRELGVLPPGDFRNCITALADDEALTTQLFHYRFRSGGLEGHSFGNIFITAMAEVTGSFEKALYESGRVLNIGGTILPSTLENVTLMAEVGEGPQTRKVEGESAIPEAKLPIERVYFEPNTVRAFPPAIQAILNADLILAGPGSLYTSVIPNLLVSDIVTAIRASSAPKIYICNVAMQPGESDNYSLADHVRAIEDHTYIIDIAHENGSEQNFYTAQRTKKPLFNYVLANNNQQKPIPNNMSHLKYVPFTNFDINGYQVIGADVIDEQHPWRHDATKLAGAVMDWYKNLNDS